MFSLLRKTSRTSFLNILSSKLFNEHSFYSAFISDLGKCSEEVIIESPYITHARINTLLPFFQRLITRGIKVTINTREPREHELRMHLDAKKCVSKLQRIGVQVLYTKKHHRKLAIIDKEILWEGSLNILSQNDSCEIMRRIESQELARQMTKFIGIERFLK